jgi:hypothetical protein
MKTAFPQVFKQGIEQEMWINIMDARYERARLTWFRDHSTAFIY